MVTKKYFLTIDNLVFKYIKETDDVYNELLDMHQEVEDDLGSATAGEVFSVSSIDISEKPDSLLDLKIETDSGGAIVDNEFTILIDPRISAKWVFDTTQKGKLRSPSSLSRRTFSVDCDEAKITPFNAQNSRKIVFTCNNSPGSKFRTCVFDMHLLNIASIPGKIFTKVILDPVIRNTT